MGAIYDKQELKQLNIFYKEKSLYLFLDDARIENVLRKKENMLTLKDNSNYTVMINIDRCNIYRKK